MQVSGTGAERIGADLDERLRAFRHDHPYREVDVGRVKWRYLVGGQGERTLLLVPGGTLVPDAFFTVIEDLERDHRVVAPAYPPVRTMADVTKGVATILDAEHVGQADVLGSSFGGYVAQCFVRHHPERVSRLVLAQTGARHIAGVGPLRLLGCLSALAPAGAVRFVFWRIWIRWVRLAAIPGRERAFWLGLLREILTRQLTKAHLVSMLVCLGDFAGRYRFTGTDLANWPGRVLILESSRDEVYSPVERAALRALYPQARIYTFRDAGHSAVFTHTGEYVAAIRCFLAEI